MQPVLCKIAISSPQAANMVQSYIEQTRQDHCMTAEHWAYRHTALHTIQQACCQLQCFLNTEQQLGIAVVALVRIAAVAVVVTICIKTLMYAPYRLSLEPSAKPSFWLAWGSRSCSLSIAAF